MTLKRTPANERSKRKYLQFLREAKGRDETSIDAVVKAIERFDDYNRRRDFRKFHIEQARAFKEHLREARSVRTGAPLSAATITSTLAALKAFFIWLAGVPEYSRRIRYADAEYFNAPENLSRAATARRHKPCPTVDQIRAVIEAMPATTEIERRDRALVAFTILTGARDMAIVSFRLKHIDLERQLLQQDAREVRTKRAKTFTTWFFPVGREIGSIVTDWVTWLREAKGFGPDDPIFPKTRSLPNEEMLFAACGIDRQPWANANPVRAIFKAAFARVGFQYFNPHSFRNTLVELAYELRLDAVCFKAWSQNLGHEHCLTTFSSYGYLPPNRQGDIMRGLAEGGISSPQADMPEKVKRLADLLHRSGFA